MEAGNKYLESGSDVLVVLLQSSDSRQSTELGLSMSEWGVSTTLDEFTTVETLHFRRFFEDDKDQKGNNATVSDRIINDR